MASQVAARIAIMSQQLRKAEEAAAAAPSQKYMFRLTFYPSHEKELVSSFRLQDDKRINRVVIIPDNHEDMTFIASRKNAIAYSANFAKTACVAAARLPVRPRKTTLEMVHVPSERILCADSWDDLPTNLEVDVELQNFVHLYYGMVPDAAGHLEDLRACRTRGI
jgi:hypothetical protein